MTEEKAIKVFQDLHPLDAELRRMGRVTASDVDEYDVLVRAVHINNDDFKAILAVASANACGLALEGEPENGPPKLVLDDYEHNPYRDHPSAPKP